MSHARTTWVLAYDFSRLAHRALALAARMLSHEGDARLVVVHAHPLHHAEAPTTRLLPFVAAELERAYVADAARQLVEDVSIADIAGVVIEPRLTAGHPAQAVCRTVFEVDARLVVVGCHARLESDAPGMGRVAEAIMRQAPCPVLVVK